MNAATEASLPASPEPLPEHPAALAYARVKVRLDALRSDELLPVNIDASRAVTKILGVAPRLQQFASQAARLPGFDVACFTELADCARALWHAHVMCPRRRKIERDIAPLVARAREAHSMLHDLVALLTRHGLIPARRPHRVRRDHVGLAYELAMLVLILREAWDSIRGKVPLTEEELNAHGALAHELQLAVGLRWQAPTSPAFEARQRAFTLLVRAYDEVRAALAYLRRAEGDAEALAPSLFAGRRNANHRKSPRATEVQQAAIVDVPTRARISLDAASDECAAEATDGDGVARLDRAERVAAV